MQSSNIVLIGFMGSGKSSVSKLLAESLRRKLYSTDSMIENRTKKTIQEIFNSKGEKHFRKLERSVIKELSSKKNAIIDCGGGIILQQANINDLKRNGCVFYLKAGPAFLYKMVQKKKNRPLLAVEDPFKVIKRILLDRKEQYEQADFTVRSENRTIKQMCEKIILIAKKEGILL